MSMKKFAEKELETIVNNAEGSHAEEMQKHINDNILELIEVFSRQGHSGMSASYTLAMFNHLAQFKPINPLTGEDDEWIDQSEKSGGMVIEQNKRCSTVFRTGRDNSTAYDIDGYTYSHDGGETWFSGGGHPVKKVEFPYHVPEEPERVILEDK